MDHGRIDDLARRDPDPHRLQMHVHHAAALQAVIVQHRVLYMPSGTYVVSSTLRLRTDGILIGFHPAKKLITPRDEVRVFKGQGEVIPLVEKGTPIFHVLAENVCHQC